MNPWVIEPSEGTWHKIVILIAALALLAIYVSGPSGKLPREWQAMDLVSAFTAE